MNARRSLRELEPVDLEVARSAAARRERPATARDGADPVHSPARALQAALETEFGPALEPKWPPIARLAFIVGTCGSFWAVVGWLVLRAL